MSEQKREVVHDIFINVHCIALSNLHPISFPDRKTVCVSYWVSGNKTNSTPNPNPQSGSTVMSRASAHGRSQLKLQNFGVGGYTEKVLKWFNYPRARAHPRCEVGSHGVELTCIVGLSVLQGQPNSGEGYIVLQSGPIRSLIAKFPQRSVVACSVWISCCKGGTLQTKPRTGVCEPDVMASKAHQSYVSSADLPSDSLCKN